VNLAVTFNLGQSKNILNQFELIQCNPLDVSTVAMFVLLVPKNVGIVFGMSLFSGVAILLKCNYLKCGNCTLTLDLLIDN